jgi:hypothetical protein
LDEYVCLRVLSEPSEPVSEFNKRLIAFWSHFLRTRPDEYKGVYAETSRFEPTGDRHARQYLVLEEAIRILESEFVVVGLECEPIDRDEVFSKFEAVAPEWFQIPH